MAGYPPKKNVAYTFEVSLTSQADTDIFQANPTLATGDAQVSKDGGSFANLGTLPSAIDAGKGVTVTMAQEEMNADRVVVLFSDAAGDEWQDLLITIDTSTRQIDDLAYPNTSGRGVDVDASGGVEVGSFQTGAITAAAIAADAIGASEIADGAIDAGAIATDAITAAKIAANAITSSEIADGAIDAGALATDAITAAKIAADAITSSELADGAITAAKIATDAIGADELAASAVDEILDEVVEGTLTMRQLLRILLAEAANISEGGGTTAPKFRDLADGKYRIEGTVDNAGNRTAVTIDGT